MFYSYPFILLRTPLQSLENAYDFTQMNSPLFWEGIYLSSPELWKEYQKHAHSDTEKKDKINLAVAKYWLRSCTRCTPYGTFAGTSLLNTETETNLLLGKIKEHQRHIRLDMNFISALIKKISESKQIKSQLKFFPNNSLYEFAEEYRFAEYFIADNNRTYHLAGVEKNHYLEKIIALTKNGATIEQLAQLLKKNEIETEEAETFIDELITSQVLLSELEPCITGKEPLENLITQLTSLKNTENILHTLKTIDVLLKNPKEGIDYYYLLEKEIKNLTEENFTNYFQEDLFISLQKNSIDKKLTDEIIKQANELLVLAKPFFNKELAEFRNKFTAKYEEAEIPMVIALDADAGIGYSGVYSDSTGDSELINDIQTEIKRNKEIFEIDEVEKFIFRKYEAWLRDKSNSVEVN